MVPKKGKSKRQGLAQKYKIEKRVKEHHRKLKKEGNRKKKNGIKGVITKAKDPGIPNEYPHKEELLKQIEKAKAGLEERKLAQKDARKDARSKALSERRGINSFVSLEGMCEASVARGQTFLAAETASEATSLAEMPKAASVAEGQNSRRAYLRELRKVVDQADVIIEVLDARDPQGSRAPAVEAAVAANPAKKLVLVVNKVDLVPRDVAGGWLTVLRRSYPAVAFKASTQSQVTRRASTKECSSAENAEAATLQRSVAVGTESLMALLKNYCRGEGGLNSSIVVGVIGYPNTGKSSLINSLKGRSVVGVSPVAGFTKASTEIVLDKSIRILDSPGIVYDDRDGDATALRNCINPEELDDPVGAVHAMLQRCGPEQLMAIYALPRFDRGDTDAFLGLVSRRLGKVRHGGIPDKDAAARTVLRDWNSGRIPFYTPPPADDDHKALFQGEAQIVSNFDKAFDPEAMMAADALVLDALEQPDSLQCVTLEPRQSLAEGTSSSMDDVNDEEDCDADVEHTEVAFTAPSTALEAKRAAKKASKKTSKN
eukprot:CAMPEP_0171773136 /NCGR_PEP_ID=MMETSP0991-20121206/55114_1 /TAXON_ID=483369 /ORGANISM="non described non described, Strain CCMP2098" /LENGTH=542 /DNA_ID=CAMNT_0012378817 /DNA_START=20 /DNA_END=1648 /DNA_ORIENTATION=-